MKLHLIYKNALYEEVINIKEWTKASQITDVIFLQTFGLCSCDGKQQKGHSIITLTKKGVECIIFLKAISANNIQIFLVIHLFKLSTIMPRNLE